MLTLLRKRGATTAAAAWTATSTGRSTTRARRSWTRRGRRSPTRSWARSSARSSPSSRSRAALRRAARRPARRLALVRRQGPPRPVRPEVRGAVPRSATAARATRRPARRRCGRRSTPPATSSRRAQGRDPAAWRADANAERISFVPGLLQTTMRYTNRPTGIQQVISFKGHRARAVIRAPAARQALERVRALCLALPEATERPSHGSPAWFVRDKRCFVMFLDDHHGDGRLALWCAAPEGMQDALVAATRRRTSSRPTSGTAGGSASASTARSRGTRSRARSRTRGSAWRRSASPSGSRAPAEAQRPRPPGICVDSVRTSDWRPASSARRRRRCLSAARTPASRMAVGTPSGARRVAASSACASP